MDVCNQINEILFELRVETILMLMIFAVLPCYLSSSEIGVEMFSSMSKELASYTFSLLSKEFVSPSVISSTLAGKTTVSV